MTDKNARRRPQQKHSAHATSPVNPSPQGNESVTPEGLRSGHDARQARNHDPATEMLVNLCQVMDTSKTYNDPLPTLDQLLVLSRQYRKEWKPLFESSEHNVDKLSSLSIQGEDVADFGQEILEYFIKKINTLSTDSGANDTPSKIETISLLMRLVPRNSSIDN
ncbi:hypothetical protein BGX27_010026 [Mortierella sp. AM989]|nr:hypothetical protein BGX27_010026 [Mortierella sp. AM989]